MKIHLKSVLFRDVQKGRHCLLFTTLDLCYVNRLEIWLLEIVCWLWCCTPLGFSLAFGTPLLRMRCSTATSAYPIIGASPWTRNSKITLASIWRWTSFVAYHAVPRGWLWWVCDLLRSTYVLWMGLFSCLLFTLVFGIYAQETGILNVLHNICLDLFALAHFEWDNMLVMWDHVDSWVLAFLLSHWQGLGFNLNTFVLPNLAKMLFGNEGIINEWFYSVIHPCKLVEIMKRTNCPRIKVSSGNVGYDFHHCDEM